MVAFEVPGISVDVSKHSLRRYFLSMQKMHESFISWGIGWVSSFWAF